MMPETEATYGDLKCSCTVVIAGTVLFLGGCVERNQISQLNPLGLTRIGTLPFSLEKGTCFVIGQQLFLGFGRYTRRNCWSR